MTHHGHGVFLLYIFITFANIRYQTMIIVLEGQKYSKSSSIDGPIEKHMIGSPVFLFFPIRHLKSVHFKKTVALSSFLSKLWYFSIQLQVKSKQSQLMLFWKIPQIWKKSTYFFSIRCLAETKSAVIFSELNCKSSPEQFGQTERSVSHY